MSQNLLEMMRGLVALHKVREQGSFNRAARDLGKSPSVVSHHVQRLEDLMRVSLIHREGRKIHFTKQGIEAAERVAAFAVAVEQLEGDFQNQMDRMGGKLAIAIHFSLSPGPFLDNLSLFLKAHPEVKLDLRVVEPDFDLISERFDLFVTLGDLPDSNLIQRRVFQVKTGFFASPDLAQHWDQIEGSARLELPWIQAPGFDRKSWCDALNLHDPATRARAAFDLVANDLDVAARLASQGLGVTTLPYLRARHYLADGSLKPIWQDTSQPKDLDIYFVWPAHEKKKRLTDALVSHLIENRRLVGANPD